MQHRVEWTRPEWDRAASPKQGLRTRMGGQVILQKHVEVSPAWGPCSMTYSSLLSAIRNVWESVREQALWWEMALWGFGR